MYSRFTRPIAKASAAFSAALLLVAAHPAFANTTANASAADMAEAAPEAPETSLANGDERFRELFASWSALDHGDQQESGSSATIIERSAVSIPSRMPVEGARLSSGFGMRVHPIHRRRRHHAGVDLAAPTGTPVYATADGIVSLARSGRGYGLYIKIDHGAALETRYAHLSRLAVAAGDRVEKGEVIGYVGSTGWSTGPHLHYEVRVDGVAVNPIPYMVESEEQTRIAQSAAESSESDEGRSDMLPGRRRCRRRWTLRSPLSDCPPGSGSDIGEGVRV